MRFMCTLETSLQIFTILGSLLAHIKPHLLVNEPMYEYCFPFNFQVSRWSGLRFSASQVPACVLLLPSFAMIVISHLVDANTVVQDDNTLALKRWGLGQVSRWWLYYIISLTLWIQELVQQRWLGPSFKVVVTWKAFPGRQVPAAGLYGALLMLIHHHIIHRPSFGRTIYSVYLDHYFWTIFSFRTIVVSAEVKDYNDLIQTASSSSSVRRQTW